MYMASKEQWRKSYKTSGVAYDVFRQIASKEEGDYATNIQNNLQSGAVEDITRLIKVFQEENVLKEGKRIKAKYYVVDPEGLSILFCDIWNIKEEDLPEKEFQAFLMRYVELYDKGDSSIRKMLREDFAEAAVSYKRQHEELPEGLEFLHNMPGLEGFIPVQDYFERAVEDVFNES